MQVKQSCLIAPHGSHFQIVCHLLKEHISCTPDYKVDWIVLAFALLHLILWHVCIELLVEGRLTSYFHSGYSFLYNRDGNITSPCAFPRNENERQRDALQEASTLSNPYLWWIQTVKTTHSCYIRCFSSWYELPRCYLGLTGTNANEVMLINYFGFLTWMD